MAASPPTTTAHWYFIGATFALTLPNLLLPGLPWWGKVVFLLAGIGIMAAGFVRLRSESRQRRAATDDTDGG